MPGSRGWGDPVEASHNSVEGVSTGRLREVREQLQAEAHQGRVWQTMTGAQLHHRRVPDRLHEQPADRVVAAVRVVERLRVALQDPLAPEAFGLSERLGDDLGG